MSKRKTGKLGEFAIMPFSDKIREEVLKKSHMTCCVCRSHPAIHVHHIKPQKDGGLDTEDNAAPLCPNCHDTYGANPEKRRFITRNRDDWYEMCENQSPANAEQIQEMLDKFGKYVATKEDVQQAVWYLEERVQNIMSEPLSISEQVVQLSDVTATFSTALYGLPVSVNYCGWCGSPVNDEAWEKKVCPHCGRKPDVDVGT